MNSVLQIRSFAYGKFNVTLILDEIFIINTVYFHFPSFKLVKQYFGKLLYKMTKIQFLSALIQINRKKHREKICIG